MDVYRQVLGKKSLEKISGGIKNKMYLTCNPHGLNYFYESWLKNGKEEDSRYPTQSVCWFR